MRKAQIRGKILRLCSLHNGIAMFDKLGFWLTTLPCLIYFKFKVGDDNFILFLQHCGNAQSHRVLQKFRPTACI